MSASKKYVSYDDLSQILDSRQRVIPICHLDEKSKKAIGGLIKLAKAFNKTFRSDEWQVRIDITKDSKVSTVFNQFQKREEKRLTSRPSAKQLKKAHAIFARLAQEEGPYAGSLSG